tara:strand:- start:1089 stop:1640 length:552 start_codon:yes stop_codon:yes gene_type:complete
MKPIVIDTLFSEDELFYLYKLVTSTNNWAISGITDNVSYMSHKIFNASPQLIIKDSAGQVVNYPMFLYFQSIIFRLKKILQEKNVGLNPVIKRAWINATYNGSKNHQLHIDADSSSLQSVLFFLTPVWKTAWKGSFYVDGEEHKMMPGRVIVFDSREFHTGEEPESETFNWLRLTANILLSNE